MRKFEVINPDEFDSVLEHRAGDVINIISTSGKLVEYKFKGGLQFISEYNFINAVKQNFIKPLNKNK